MQFTQSLKTPSFIQSHGSSAVLVYLKSVLVSRHLSVCEIICRHHTHLLDDWAQLHDVRTSYSLSCGRTISPLCRWSLRWRAGSWRNAGWSGSAWWSPRPSSCRCRWPGRSCCQGNKRRKVGGLRYAALRLGLYFSEAAFHWEYCFFCRHKRCFCGDWCSFCHHTKKKINGNCLWRVSKFNKLLKKITATSNSQ